MTFGLTIIALQPPHLYIKTNPESYIVDNLSWKMKKHLTLTGIVKTIFQLKDLSFIKNNV